MLELMPEIALEAAHPATRSWRVRASGLLAHRQIRYVGGVVLLAVLYRGAAQVGYAVQFAGPVAAIVWLPVGVGIAFLYLGGLRYWPGILVGDLLANNYAALPLGTAIGQTCGNVLEVVVATLLLCRLVPRGDPLGSVSGLVRMLAAIAVGTAVSATIGACASLIGGVIAGGDMVHVWHTWWLGDLSGALIVLPLALAWAKPLRRWPRRHGLEMVLVLVTVAALSELALRSEDTLTYVVFPALLWSALRLGQRGTTLAVAVAAGFAIWETTRHTGPFAFDSVGESVISTQLYIAVSSLSALCVAAVVAQREAFAARLAASRVRLVEAAAVERRRIAGNLHDGAQQRLTALCIRLGVAAEQARDDPEIAGRLQAAEIELEAAIEELREFAHGIYPSVLSDHGLSHALNGLAARSSMPLHLVELPAARVDATAEMTAYFVVSEAVTNARKHAEASRIDLRVATGRRVLRVEIADDGVGGAGESAGSGLQGLRDRVEAIGGSFAVDSRAGRGTRIVAVLPATIRQAP